MYITHQFLFTALLQWSSILCGCKLWMTSIVKVCDTVIFSIVELLLIIWIDFIIQNLPFSIKWRLKKCHKEISLFSNYPMYYIWCWYASDHPEGIIHICFTFIFIFLSYIFQISWLYKSPLLKVPPLSPTFYKSWLTTSGLCKTPDISNCMVFSLCCAVVDL